MFQHSKMFWKVILSYKISFIMCNWPFLVVAPHFGSYSLFSNHNDLHKICIFLLLKSLKHFAKLVLIGSRISPPALSHTCRFPPVTASLSQCRSVPSVWMPLSSTHPCIRQRSPGHGTLTSVWSGQSTESSGENMQIIISHLTYMSSVYPLCWGELLVRPRLSSLFWSGSWSYEPHWSTELHAGDLLIIWPRRFLGFAEVYDLKIE